MKLLKDITDKEKIEAFDRIYEKTLNYYEFIDSSDFNEDALVDKEYDIFQEAMELTLGDKVFDEINEYL